MDGSFWMDMLGGTVDTVHCQGEISEDYQIRYLTKGTSDEPPVLLLHGLGGHAETFIKNVCPLSIELADQPVYAFDFIGHGLSSAPTDLEYHISDYVSNCVDFISAINADSVHVSGVSLGSWVAGRLAIDHSHLVESLTMNAVEGVYCLDGGSVISESMIVEDLADLDDLYDRTIQMIDGGITSETVKRRLQVCFLGGPDDELVEVRRRLYQNEPTQSALPITHKTYVSDSTNPDVAFSERELRSMDVETLIIHPTNSTLARKEFAEYLHQLMPNSRLELYENSGHWPHYEEAQKFNNHQANFIRSAS